MKSVSFKKILLIGSDRLTAGIATNLLRSGAAVCFLSGDPEQQQKLINENIADCNQYEGYTIATDRLQYITLAAEAKEADLAVVITEEDLAIKKQWASELEKALSAETIIAFNTESFTLKELQQDAEYPERMIGLNWCHPAHTTAFLEIIVNNSTPGFIAEQLETTARHCWQKDPYTVLAGYSVRARMMAALTREAFYLVENGYASVEDIDRACRNDAGYYLPFAGNCRYMDLMGTYAYGLVMKDLNRELSKQHQLPAFFASLMEAGKTGMETGAGFYNYTESEQKNWEEKLRKFSFEIKEIISKYPFGFLKEEYKKHSSKITLDE
ncbi:MAG: 3-hydroxyacyl-CoA dehydrogenase family protein [Agriterribacter sp.]